MTKISKTKWTSKSQSDDIEAIIDRAVADAIERLDLDTLIRNAFEELDIGSIIRQTLAELQAG